MRKYDRKGVKTFNLFKVTWKAGRLIEKKNTPAHLVIYGPDDKEYHVYGDDAKSLRSYCEYRNEYYLDKTKLKIYVLTSILDEREKWCFDMTKFPKPGPVKVIFEDVTIQWIEFTGDWENHRREIHTEIPTRLNPEWKSGGKESQHIWEPTIEYRNIIAWRI